MWDEEDEPAQKKTKTRIPDGTQRVWNVVTGETKIWCAMCGKWGDHGSAKHFEPIGE